MYTENTGSTQLFTVNETSRLLGVTEETVRNMTKDGRLDSKIIKHRLYITAESLKRLVKKGANK